MSKNNIKLLTYRQRVALNDRYIFYYDSENELIHVKIKDYDRETVHPIKENFSITAKVRRITFTTEAMNIWNELMKKGYKYTLVDVQYIVNKCYVLYQKIDEKSVLEKLKEEIPQKK